MANTPSSSRSEVAKNTRKCGQSGCVVNLPKESLDPHSKCVRHRDCHILLHPCDVCKDLSSKGVAYIHGLLEKKGWLNKRPTDTPGELHRLYIIW